jgi:signal transduction histidine kinase
VHSLPPRVDIAAYRIVQESLTNVAKHSAARQAHVTVDYRPDAVRLTVVDPGPARAHDGPARGPGGAGHGIKGMQERAAELGGRLSAQRRFDGGFGVEAELPLKGRP